MKTRIKTQYWTEKDTKRIITWLKGGCSDDAAYLLIEPVLTQHAYGIIKRYANNCEWWFNGTREDLTTDLVVHAATKLHTYNSEHHLKKTLFSYTTYLMINYIHNQYQTATRKKRDYKLRAWNGSIGDGKEGVDYVIHSQIKIDDFFEYRVFQDPFFIEFVCDWWHANKDEVFNTTKKNTKTVNMILSVIQYPGLHPIKGQMYSGYITKKCNISKQRLIQIIHIMRTKSPILMGEWHSHRLLKTILK